MTLPLPSPLHDTPLPEAHAGVRGRLRILVRRLAAGSFAGSYASTFRGRGIEFDELKEYQPGDDIRDIDWNVTARTGRPFVKRFVEERELTVMLMLDCSASMATPSSGETKRELALELCALLAAAAGNSNDRVGLLTFSDRVLSYTPPAKGRRHTQKILSALSTPAMPGAVTDIAGALSYFMRVSRRRAVLFLISDFISGEFSSAMGQAARRHELLALQVSAPQDMRLPECGLFRARGAEGASTRLIDSGSTALRQTYARLADERQAHLRGLTSSCGAELFTVSTGSDPLRALHGFFRSRQVRQGNHP